MMRPNPYQQYQTTQIQTASPGELVVLLYDGAIRYLTRAQAALAERRLEDAGADLVRAQELVLELLAGLDLERGGTLAGNLRDLYLFIYKTLVEANVRKDALKVATALRLLEPVRAAWQTVVRGEAEAAQPLRGGMVA
ncbi:MAG: flagellar export chaperone FliS [Chloroflexota bacterium]